MPARRKRTTDSAPAAGSIAQLPSEVLHAIVERLPPNCIPLAIRQLSKELRQHYMHHTTVQAAGNGFLPAWAVLAALPCMNDDEQMARLMAALARRGDLEGLHQFVQQLPWSQNSSPSWGKCMEAAMCAAAAAGNLHVVRWLVEEQGYGDTSSQACISAASGGHPHVLDWLRSQQPPFQLYGYNAYAAAADGGHVAVLCWQHRQGCRRWDAVTCRVAAAAGQLEALQCLISCGCPIDSEALFTAASHGHIAVVRWLHNEGYPWTVWCCLAAAHSGHLDVMQYCMAEGCPTDGVDLSGVAAHGRHKEVLLWLRQHGYAWGTAVCEAAAREGDVQLLSWLREQEPPCPWDEGVLRAVAVLDRAGAAQCLEYALDNGCPWSLETYKLVQGNPKLRHVPFPGMRRSTRRHKA